MRNKILLITKHKKEQAIAPLFALHDFDIVTAALDTDQLGSFSGEVARAFAPLECAKEKIKLGIEKLPDYNFYLASEGSFFSHPEMPFLTVDEECLVLYDVKQDHFFEVKYHTYSPQAVSDMEIDLQNADEVLGLCDFPKHDVILKSFLNDELVDVYKDCDDLAYVKSLLTNTQVTWKVENDLRAMNNPTRMEAIAEATKLLIEEIQINCASCGSNKTKMVKKVLGLKCEICEIPSNKIKGETRQCLNCNAEWFVAGPKTFLDPQYCDFCNP